MTSLLPSRPAARSRASGAARTPGQLRSDLLHRRPMALLATLGGFSAAIGPLLVCMAVGVVGWFLTDSGTHGTAGGGMRTGALAWLMGHGSGVHIQGAAVTMMPIGITLVCAATIWRLGVRVGEGVSGHGPDAQALAAGEKDLTVPVSAGLFLLGYVVTAMVVVSVAGSSTTAPSDGRVMLWSILLSGLVGGPAIAVGSGRAAVWLAPVREGVRQAATLVRTMLVAWVVVGAVVFAVALLADLGTAVNVMSQLHLSAGSAVLYIVLMLMLVPNAAIFAGSYLLGPGFTMGVATMVSPTAVTLGPLPMVPMLAALPDDGPTPGWTMALLALAPLTAAFVVVRRGRILSGTLGGTVAVAAAAGFVAAILLGIVAALAGGAIGPGRMADVGPFAWDTLLRAIPSFALGGAIGAVVAHYLPGRRA